LPAVQQLRSRRILPLDPIERLFQAAFDQVLTDVFHRLGAAAIRLGNLPIRPRRAIDVGLEQNLSPPNLLAGSTQPLHNDRQLFPLLIGQTNYELLSHQSLLAPKNKRKDYPNSLM
jgi:hypothetical protein